MAYGSFKYLTRRTASDKILLDKTFIAKTPINDGYHHGLASMFYKFFDKKLQLEQLKMRIIRAKNYLKNYINQLLKNSRKEKHHHLLEEMFGVLM